MAKNQASRPTVKIMLPKLHKENYVTVATQHRRPQAPRLFPPPPHYSRPPLENTCHDCQPTPPEQILCYSFFFEPLAPDSKVSPRCDEGWEY